MSYASEVRWITNLRLLLSARDDTVPVRRPTRVAHMLNSDLSVLSIIKPGQILTFPGWQVVSQ